MSGLLVLTLAGLMAPAPREPVTVPFDLLASRHMAVHVVVNGKGPYRVIFDTGAPINLLSPKVAKEAGVTVERRPRPNQPGVPLLPLGPNTKVAELEIGELTVKDLPVMVFDHPTVKAIAGVLGPLEGILGFPLFARFRVTLDYEKKQMTFEPVDYDPGDVMAGLMRTMMGNRKEAVVKPLASPAVLGVRVEAEAGALRVAEVYSGSVAAGAGLQPGDVLLTLDGHWLTNLADLHRALVHLRPGKEVKLQFKRGDLSYEENLKVRLGL
jgi:membrane-associated protease RseP (regulator of RpoE activity)